MVGRPVVVVAAPVVAAPVGEVVVARRGLRAVAGDRARRGVDVHLPHPGLRADVDVPDRAAVLDLALDLHDLPAPDVRECGPLGGGAVDVPGGQQCGSAAGDVRGGGCGGGGRRSGGRPGRRDRRAPVPVVVPRAEREGRACQREQGDAGGGGESERAADRHRMSSRSVVVDLDDGAVAGARAALSGVQGAVKTSARDVQ
nr:hypothetical protein [Pseudonocardia dioxanivorans]